MPLIVDDLPINPRDLRLMFPEGTARRKPRQIVLWVSIAEEGSSEIPDRTSYFPAVLDTGFNDCFLIQEIHLVEWARIDPYDLTPVGELLLPFVDGKNNRRTALIRQADIWIHPNLPGSHDQLSGQHPFRLELPTGIAVPPADLVDFPRLPLLGMHVLEPNRLEVTIRGADETVSIRTTRRKRVTA